MGLGFSGGGGGGGRLAAAAVDVDDPDTDLTIGDPTGDNDGFVLALYGGGGALNECGDAEPGGGGGGPFLNPLCGLNVGLREGGAPRPLTVRVELDGDGGGLPARFACTILATWQGMNGR